jgi:hypothetical protein
MPGTRLGAYEITAQIGEGGSRDVALNGPEESGRALALYGAIGDA